MPTPSKSGYAPVNGVEVYYAVYGEGSPIILLHGGLMSGSSFAPIIDTLTEKHQVVTVDLQGHGHTLPFDRPMTFEAMADDVAGIITYLKLEKPAVMGYSLGATTALRLAIQHPDLVSKLINVSAPYNFAEGWHDYNLEGMRSMTSGMAEGMMQSPMYATYAAEAPDARNFPVLLDKVGDMMRAGFDYSEDVKQLKVPTMLVEYMKTISDNPIVILLLINIVLLVLGTFMDMSPLIVITTPIFLPVATAFGVDPVHFGIILILNLGIGLCTPPVGAVLFVGCAVGKIPIWQAMRTIWPFYAAAVVTLLLVTYIPAISLWLPRLFH